MRYADIDWGVLWQQEQEDSQWQLREAAVWDARAAAFADRNKHSGFERQCLELLAPRPEWTVLDVGSGPGTLGVPLAARVRRVTCVDFSAAMLEQAKRRAQEEGVHNLSTIRASWTDDWQALGIVPHDVVIAARSLSVRDILAALRRLHAYGIHRRVVVDRVGAGPVDPAAFAAVGRPLRRGPDYMHTFNALYQLGHHATLAYVYGEKEHRHENFEKACTSYNWMLPDLDEEERERLRRYILSIATEEADGSVVLRPEHRSVWAFMSW